MRSTKMSSNMNIVLIVLVVIVLVLSIVLVMNQTPKQAIENFDNHMPAFDCPAPSNPETSMPVHTYNCVGSAGDYRCPGTLDPMTSRPAQQECEDAYKLAESAGEGVSGDNNSCDSCNVFHNLDICAENKLARNPSSMTKTDALNTCRMECPNLV